MDTQFNSTLHDIVSRVLVSEELERKMALDIADLEQEAFDYILDCTPPDYALWTLDQTFVVLSPQIWQNSRTLMSHSPVGKYHSVEWSFQTVENLKRLAHVKVFPRDLSQALELIALVKYLYIPSLLKMCYDHFCHGTARQGFQDVAICAASLPATCSRGTILRIWELVCASPMRSKAIYQQYFKLVQDYCVDIDFINLAKRINKARCKEYLLKNIEGLPVDLSRTTAPIGLFIIGGEPTTAVIGNGSFVPTDIFGRAFKKELKQTVRDFFLLYNRYVIYRDQYADVYHQVLNPDVQPVKIASNICQFLHKVEHLFLLGKNWADHRNRVHKWSGTALLELYPTDSVGEHLDFDPESSILCYENARGDVICLDFLKETSLSPCRRIEHGCIRSFVLYQRELFVWGKHSNRVYGADGHAKDFARVPGVSQSVVDCRVVCGQLYLRMTDGWRIYREGRLQDFCAGSQLVAFAEICLNPYLLANPT